MMRRPLLVSLTLVVTFVASSLADAKGTSATYSDRAAVFREAARKVAPCVVTIETVGGTQPREAGGPMAGAAPRFVVADGPTTGLTWSADGLILTSSFNFIRDPSVITVVLADGRRFVAELLARDEIRHLAMLKIDATGLPVPQWTDPDRLHVGAWALSLGHGQGQLVKTAATNTGGCTITAGIISGLRRMSGLCVQTDTHLSPANFGGPLIDIDGRVIGLCVPIGRDVDQLSGVEWYDSGIGFAVPRPQAEQSARDLAAGHNIRLGVLGVVAAPSAKEVVVTALRDPSPAARAGLQVGDRIIAIGDTQVIGFGDLRRALRPLSAGTRVMIHIIRDKKTLDLPLTLATYEDLGPVPPSTTKPDNKP